jgi:hypothetical protein
MSYYYTGWAIVTITVHDKMIADEIRCVKVLAGELGDGWVQDIQMDGVLYDGDKLKATKKMVVRDGVRGSIMADYDVHTIFDIHHMSDLTKQRIILDRKMTDKTLTQLQNRVKDAHEGSAPANIDHKKAANTYKSRYGDAWEDVIVDVHTFKKVRCIAKRVIHIAKETYKSMIGTKNEDGWYFYHNALSQLT